MSRAVRPQAPPVPPPTMATATPSLSSALDVIGSAASAAAGGPGPDEVVVKKAALVTMKSQVSALIWGEELSAPQPGAPDILEVPYTVPAVGRDDTKCPVCHLSFRTGFCLRKHMDVHRGEQFPCGNCNKLLASHQMLRESMKRAASRAPGIVVTSVTRTMPPSKVSGSTPGLSMVWIGQHRNPHYTKAFKVKKSMKEHATTCSQNPTRKGPFFCQVEGCPSKDHPFSRIKNLNAHMSPCHGWKEHHQ